MKIRRVAALRTAAKFQEHLDSIGVSLAFDEDVLSDADSPMAQPVTWRGGAIGNRFAILPMEGWDGQTDGRPSELVERRWRRFGESGAKLIWGCEAVAVRPDGRANPHQLMILPETVGELTRLREMLVKAHTERFGRADDLLVGLQLTHSGRFARPYDKKRLEPHILYHHPLLDAKFGVTDDGPLMGDGDIERLIAVFVQAAVFAQDSFFFFLYIKHCHGYLGHEFLSALDRPGRYGGSFENRTRFLREITAGIRSEAPGIEIGVRLSAFDFAPFQPGGDEQRGELAPLNSRGYPYAFGGDGSGIGIDLGETLKFLDLLQELDIQLVCITAGSPYYNPHIQRPALFPPSDGYQPPEDPLAGVARQIATVAELKKQRPDLLYVGSGYSYLQDWFPNVAQNSVRTQKTDFVGIGRMVLSYPHICTDILAGEPLARKRICRTFSDCTTAPRNGMVSGWFPVEGIYKARPEYERLQTIKRKQA